MKPSIHTEKRHPPDIFDVLLKARKKLSIPSSISAPPTLVLNTLASCLRNYGDVSLDERFLYNGYRKYLLHFNRPATASLLNPRSDAAQVTFSFDEIRMKWEVRGHLFGLDLDVDMPPRPFFRLLVNNIHQENAAKVSFFHWAEKYAERYGTAYAHMLYQLGLQLVGTGTMKLDLQNPMRFAVWASQTDPQFVVYFSLVDIPDGLPDHKRLMFGFYEEPATHVFEGSQHGFQKCLDLIREHENMVKKVADECVAKLQGHERLSTEDL